MHTNVLPSCRLSAYQMAELVGLIQKGRQPMPSEAQPQLMDLLGSVYRMTWEEFTRRCAATARYGTITAARVFQNIGRAPEELVAEYLSQKVGYHGPAPTTGTAASPAKASPRKLHTSMKIRFLKQPDEITKPGNKVHARLVATPKQGKTVAEVLAMPGAMTRGDILWAVEKGVIELVG